jgi:hypothetical protein
LPANEFGGVEWSTAMNNADEPPSCLRPPVFMIGQDSRGNWVVQDKTGARGGLFVDRAEALRYVRSESARHALVTVVGCLELDIPAAAVAVSEAAIRASHERRVA